MKAVSMKSCIIYQEQHQAVFERLQSFECLDEFNASSFIRMKTFETAIKVNIRNASKLYMNKN